tara:strand:+ start:16 stop:795 length:780 start_codon:yes stop_codon:yes gene_type:complete
VEIFFFYIFIGFAGGIIGGFLGLGGGIIFVPSLLLIFTSYNIFEGYQLQSAIITSLGCVLISSSSAMITHYRNQLILWDSLRKTSFGITIGVFLGVFLLSKSNTDLLKYIYSSLLIIIAVLMICYRQENKRIKTEYKFVTSFSIFVGSISTLLGVGGGTLTTPYFNFHGENIKKSIATASACGVLIALVAMVASLIQGFISYDKSLLSLFSISAFLCISSASTLSAYLGASMTVKIKPKNLKLFFAISLIIISITILKH